MAARCLPRRRRPRPARAPLPLVVGAARSTLAASRPGGFVQAAVDAYARTGHRPPWLSPELLDLLERQGRLVGVIYLLHFDRPIGDPGPGRSLVMHKMSDSMATRMWLSGQVNRSRSLLSRHVKRLGKSG